MLEKQVVVDSIEALENGIVQVRTATKIMDNGVQVSQTFHRHIVVPGQDYSNEDAKVQEICKAKHTKEAIAAYKDSQVTAQVDTQGE
jgi:hypothetical protein